MVSCCVRERQELGRRNDRRQESAADINRFPYIREPRSAGPDVPTVTLSQRCWADMLVRPTSDPFSPRPMPPQEPSLSRFAAGARERLRPMTKACHVFTSGFRRMRFVLFVSWRCKSRGACGRRERGPVRHHDRFGVRGLEEAEPASEPWQCRPEVPLRSTSPSALFSYPRTDVRFKTAKPWRPP